MIKVLHFADAHIDIANYGRHDPESGLPLRVLDFLKALDTIVDTAIDQKVDLVIFAGDAYKDRAPAPTFQREWGRRIMRLSRAGIETLLLVGNHDLSPAQGRAHALQEYDTLDVSGVHVIDKSTLLTPQQLGGLPVQVMAIPWISRSSIIASRELSIAKIKDVDEVIEETFRQLMDNWFTSIDRSLPTILTAHATVEGAVFGSERSIMLGQDIKLPRSVVRDPRLDYVALGHIHKAQNLNENAHPPVIYSGSIEKVDFGEAQDEKYFVIAQIERGKTEVEWHKLDGRRFISKRIDLSKYGTDGLPKSETLMNRIKLSLSEIKKIEDSIVRLTLIYPYDWEPLINEPEIRNFTKNAYEFHIVRRPKIEARIRLNTNQAISTLGPIDLLDLYWKANNFKPQDIDELDALARTIIGTDADDEIPDQATQA